MRCVVRIWRAKHGSKRFLVAYGSQMAMHCSMANLPAVSEASDDSVHETWCYPQLVAGLERCSVGLSWLRFSRMCNVRARYGQTREYGKSTGRHALPVLWRCQSVEAAVRGKLAVQNVVTASDAFLRRAQIPVVCGTVQV